MKYICCTTLIMLWALCPARGQQTPEAEYSAVQRIEAPKKPKSTHIGNRYLDKDTIKKCFYGDSPKYSAMACASIGDSYKQVGDIQTARGYWKKACEDAGDSLGNHWVPPCLDLARSFSNVLTKRYVLENDSGCYNDSKCLNELANSYETEQPIDKEAAAYRYQEACTHSRSEYHPEGCYKACTLKSDFDSRSTCLINYCYEVNQIAACERACEGAPSQEAYSDCLDRSAKTGQGWVEMYRQRRLEQQPSPH